MTKDEALKLALEALEPVAKEYAEQYEGEIPSNVADAITAIKEALAQPEQELVATWENKYGMKEWEVHALRAGWSLTPPQRKPLTENEIKHLWYEACQTNLELTSQLIVHLARNIEAAHGIKGEA